jgi:peptidoglycan/xylan/chitin deacetylase (PgdA/CDA1 family)
VIRHPRLSHLGSPMRSMLRQAAGWIAYTARLHARAARGRVVILMYHRVLSEGQVDQQLLQPGMYVTTSAFERQVRLLRSDFDVLSLGELLQIWRRGPLRPDGRFCVLTFDDGWADNYANAYPILKQYQVPATIFVPTAYIGTRQWFWTDAMAFLLTRWDDGGLTPDARREVSAILAGCEHLREILAPAGPRADRASQVTRLEAGIAWLKQWPTERAEALVDKLCRASRVPLPDERMFLDWTEIEEMSQRDISFGSHSRSHRILVGLPHSQALEELQASMCALKARSVNWIPVLCYPNGTHDHCLRELARACGYEAALGVASGHEGSLPGDTFDLRRIGVHEDVSGTLAQFSFLLLGLPRGDGTSCPESPRNCH